MWLLYALGNQKVHATHFINTHFIVVKVKVAQSCPTLCDPMDYTVPGILQARILEWVAFPFSRGSSQPSNRTGVSCTADWFFTDWHIREAHIIGVPGIKPAVSPRFAYTEPTPPRLVHHRWNINWLNPWWWPWLGKKVWNHKSWPRIWIVFR